MQDVINRTALDNARRYRDDFAGADPFRHVLMEDFLEPGFLARILEEFPEPDPETMRSEFGRKSRKHAVHDITGLGPAFRHWDATLRSPAFISWLEDVTGIPDLLYDPEYHGAGTHNNMDGQGMDVHIDFNLHRTTGYHRRLNLIVYLCEEWDPAWGGNIRLHKNPWERETDYYREYPPFANHAVLFETNEYSWHGFDNIRLPADKKHLSRKSLTVYYYTRRRPREEVAPKHGTIYVQKGLPDAVKPGEVLTPEAYAELKQLVARRDNFMRGLYKRESNLLVRVENLKHRVARLESAAARPPGLLQKIYGKLRRER